MEFQTGKINMNFSINGIGLNRLKNRRQRFGIGSLISLTLMGLVFLGLGSIPFLLEKAPSSWVKTQGKVIDVGIRSGESNAMYSPTVEYSVDGQKYTAQASSSTSSRSEIGSSLSVAYNPNNPTDAVVSTPGTIKLIMAIFPIIGALLVIIGPVAYIKSRRRDKQISRIKSRGHKSQGILVDIQNFSNGPTNSSYKIVVAAADINGNTQNYVSDTMAGLGGLAMLDYRSNPVPIDVYLDPTDASNYYVDVSDIPNLSPQQIASMVASAANRNAPPNPVINNFQPLTAQPTQTATHIPAPVSTSSQPAVDPTYTPVKEYTPPIDLNQVTMLDQEPPSGYDK